MWDLTPVAMITIYLEINFHSLTVNVPFDITVRNKRASYLVLISGVRHVLSIWYSYGGEDFRNGLPGCKAVLFLYIL
jgi:hypothetical protein